MKDFAHSLFQNTVCAAIAAMLFCAATSHAQSASPISAASPVFREITDEAGRTVRVPQPVNRIVSLAPSLTETVYALGLQDRLVGDTDYCDYPADAQKKTKVGGGISPSLEVIASLHPDLVLVTKSFNRLETVHSLDNLGISSYATDPHTSRKSSLPPKNSPMSSVFPRPAHPSPRTCSAISPICKSA